jgi:transposase
MKSMTYRYWRTSPSRIEIFSSHERQESWFEGLECAFLAFGGVPDEVLIDNARALVAEHDAQTRTVVFNPRLLAFTRHSGFRHGPAPRTGRARRARPRAASAM